MFGLGYIVQNVSTILSGLGFVPMKSESGNAFDLSYIPVSKIKTDEKNFQNRADKYSAKSVEAIIKAVKNGNFNWFAFDPVLLWENENGDLIVLSGHSRTEAFRRLSAENPDLEIDGLSFKKIPAKIFKGSFANAKNLALNSNALSTPETLIERAEFYRKQRKNLSSNADIKALRDKALRENQGSVIWDLSYLPENGLALDSLKRFKLQEDSEAAFENFIRAVNIAQWIGKAFQIYKGLSSAHDAELFKFLLKNYGNKSGQYNSFSKLNERLSVLYPRNVKDDKKINEKGEYQNAFGLAIFEKNDDEISELENLKTDSDKAKRELQNKIKDLRGRTTDKAKIFEVVTPYFNEYINNLFQYWQELDRERQKIVDKNQGSLFGLGATYKQTSLLFPDTANVNKNLITTKGGLQVSIPFKGQSKQLAFDFDAVVKDIKEDLKKAETVEDVEQTQEKVEEINKVLDIVADNIAKALEEQITESEINSLPPSGIETDATFIPFGYEKITDEKVIQRFNENRNILNNSGLIPVSDIISVIEKKPSVIFTTAGTDGILKYKFKGKEDGEFIFEAVNDNGEPIPGEINLRFYHNGIERLNALKSWFINPESTSKTSDVQTVAHRSVNFDNFQKRFENASGWASMDPERSARVNRNAYQEVYNKYITEVPEGKEDAFDNYFNKLLDDLISKRSRTASVMVTGSGGISARKAQRLNDNADRYFKASAEFEDNIADFVNKLQRSARRADFVAKSNEERSDARFFEIKNEIDVTAKYIDAFAKFKKDKSLVPQSEYENYFKWYNINTIDDAIRLYFGHLSNRINLNKAGVYDKIRREYNNGNNITVNRLLDYLKDKNLFTDKHKIWNLRKLVENKEDFDKLDDVNKIFEGAEIIENRQLDRVQIKFDGIPNAGCRDELKKHGFRWSPFYKVWQRQLTWQAVRKAYEIVSKFYNEIPTSLGKPTIKFEFESNDDLKNFLRENKDNLIDSYIDVSEDSTDLKPLNGFVFSENTAVFNCPMSELNCMGFKPTYKKLSSYDDLIDKAQGDKTLVGYGFETATLEELNNACKYYKQVEKLAAHLKADTPLQSAFNVWYFLHDNILYNYDTEGQEEIRTPARTWQDRFKGVDCDCLAVFTACLLYNMGYKPAFEIVGFNNNDCYSHIFVNLDGLAVDRVLPVFLKRPSGITKTFIMNIPVFELNGGVDMLNDCELSGIFESTLKKVNSKNATTADNIDFQKIQTLLCLQNSDSNAYKLASILMPFVSAIDDNGNYYFSDSTVADYAEKADNIISNLYTSGATKEDFNNFFNDFVSSFREISVECNTTKDAPFVSVTITNAAKPFTVEGNMIEKKLITLNPNFNRIKEAILFLLSINYADLAKKIAVGLLPFDRVVNNGYNEEKWENAKIANAKLFEFWRLLGGDTALLIENIKDGYYNNLSGCKTLSGVDSIDETITTDIAVERIGNFLAVMLDWYKDIEPLNIIQNNETNFVNSVSANSNSLEDNSLLSSKAFVAEQPKISVNNPGLWIVAAAALGLSAVALSKNKK